MLIIVQPGDNLYTFRKPAPFATIAIVSLTEIIKNPPEQSQIEAVSEAAARISARLGPEHSAPTPPDRRPAKANARSPD
ncbi:hypothetical protein [Leisingera sp.]|uniref:hypothetical protein n=1 Tax=Leisingera sp. TaxID=1879318 RepID=UPI002B272DDD|nr:hypothetical protein [Leisingera sp.]